MIEPEMRTTVKGFDEEYAYLRMRATKLLSHAEDGELSFLEKPKTLSNIHNIVFTGFKKSISSKAKFGSDSERKAAKILEDSEKVLRWEKLNEE
jgi:hypothetical protein